MADIFISYSKKEPQLTIDLARDLEVQGYTVWWDTTGLLPGDSFPAKIRAEITAARAVIVIWSAASVISEWVYSEAEMAQRQSKLVTVHTPGLDLNDIPMPFNGKHSNLVSDRAKIYAALAMRGLTPKAEPLAPVSRAPICDCDLLAASPGNPDSAPPGVAFERIDAERAIPACEKAVRQYPHEKRFAFQLARGLQAAKRYAEAKRIYEKIAGEDYSSAITALGFMYANGQSVAKDEAEAVRLYRRAADMGNAGAINNLGVMYANGQGVAKDEAEAVRLYRRAADMGYADAIVNLGVVYMYGRGVAKDEAEALRLFRLAAETENAVAIYNLGFMYESGRGGVAKDLAEAKRLYHKASDLGDGNAKQALKWLGSTAFSWIRPSLIKLG